jgi:hypothetical protein
MTSTRPDIFFKRPLPQDFAALLDRLLAANMEFIRIARKYCYRGTRSPENQRALRQRLDACIDALIEVYVKCEIASDRIATDAATRPEDYEIVLWRRAVAIMDIVVKEQADALDDVAQREQRPL